LLGFGSPALLAGRYTNAFGSFVKGAVAQLIGVWFAILMAQLLTSAAPGSGLAGWRDIANRSNLMGPPEVRGWANRMLDRIGRRTPRLARRGMIEGAPRCEALRDLRTGVAIGELGQVRLQVPSVYSLVDRCSATSVRISVRSTLRRLLRLHPNCSHISTRSSQRSQAQTNQSSAATRRSGSSACAATSFPMPKAFAP
jgi:hypothetical protein